MLHRSFVAFLPLTLAAAVAAGAQSAASRDAQPPLNSANVHLMSHVPLGHPFTVSGIEMEQELSRPYVYVSRMLGATYSAGFSIVSVKDPAHAKVLLDWTIPDAELHAGFGGMEGKYFKLHGRYYYVQCFQFNQGSPDAELGAIVFDVTGLPDPTKVKEVGRFRAPKSATATIPGGFHNVFPYKHSDGRTLMFATTLSGTYATIFDLEKFLKGDPDQGFVARVPVPYATGRYHDFYIGYDPGTHQDKFYGGAQPGGYFVFDVTTPETPKLLTSVIVDRYAIVSAFGRGHTITPTPDGRYVITETEYQYSPLRIFDLRPGLEGKVDAIREPIGAWTANWKNLAHNHEVRWPYIFVSGYEDGLQIFNLIDPERPTDVGFYRTYDGPHMAGLTQQMVFDSEPSLKHGSGTVLNGAWGIDVRNADGLIVISDMTTGFWAFRLDGFDGWNGHRWGMPDISSVQDWDKGPDGAKKRASAASK